MFESRGRRSRNKVSVGEPSKISLSKPVKKNDLRTYFKHYRETHAHRAPPSYPWIVRPHARRATNEPQLGKRQGILKLTALPSHPIHGVCVGTCAAI
ncbi:hypothetical protein H5410_019331 [Solanum commersonii]|uniref:Uncharacterized protein n=1 Tax=Solanum commersonii TaxID=4109 RepID=A0A9J5Z5Y0_SOLCO|nr:hypothetical protein H5410_019331 [Solanum commersonii]